SQLANVKSQSQVISQQLGMSPEQALLMTSISQISGIQDILKEIQQLQSKLANRQTILENSHPEIIDIRDKIISLNRVIDQSIDQALCKNKLHPQGNLELSALQQQLSTRLVEL
ncbi:MAG: lipopolysaccharide biosynthesis protein, partial [Dolichospermum sp.]